MGVDPAEVRAQSGRTYPYFSWINMSGGSVTGLGVVAVHDFLLDPTAVGDGDALTLCPFPNSSVLVPIDRRGAPGARSGRPSGATGAGHLGAGREIWRQRVTHFRRVLLGQIDLVLGAVNCELDGL